MKKIKDNYAYIIFSSIFVILNIFFLRYSFINKYGNGSGNRKLFLILFLAIILIELLYIFIIHKKQNKWQIEKIFLLIAVPLGILYMLFIPINGAPDEFAHLYRAYEISQGGFVSKKIDSGVGSEFTVSVGEVGSNLSEVLNLKYSDLIKAAKVKNKTEKKFYSFHTSALYSAFCYIPQATGIFVARILHLPIILQLYFARIFNFISWITIMYFCIKLIPSNKILIFLISLLPMCFQQAISSSPDAMTIACAISIFTFVSYFLKNKKKKFTKKEVCIMWTLTILMSMLKIVYIPICFLLILIPKEKFGDNKKKYIHLACLFLVAILMNIIWLKISFNFIVETNPGVNSTKQVKYILNNPLLYVSIFFNSFVYEFDTLLYCMLGSNLGWLNIEVNRVYLFGLMLLLFFVSLYDGDTKLYDSKFKLVSCLIVISVITLIFTSLYVQWNPVANSKITGVQGRYFLPILLFILSMLRINSKYNFKNKMKYIYLFMIFINIYVLSVCFIHHL